MTEEPKQNADEKVANEVQSSRRAVLKGMLNVTGALSLGGILYGAYQFLSPGAGAVASVEIPLESIRNGGSTVFQFGTSPGILLRREDGSFKAFSLVCTHLACTVQWNPEKKTFFCPCHDGFFDEEGKVISGPPPGPLEALKVEVKGNQVLVGAG
jgi:Rieske Fe-S protein